MVQDERIVEMFLDDKIRTKLKAFYFDENIECTPSLIKVQSLIQDYASYVRSCKENHTLVKHVEQEKLRKRVKSVISMIEDEMEEYRVSMYFYSWYYNTILAIFNKINAQDYGYINEEVMTFSKNFRILINKHEDILF